MSSRAPSPRPRTTPSPRLARSLRRSLTRSPPPPLAPARLWRRRPRTVVGREARALAHESEDVGPCASAVYCVEGADRHLGSRAVHGMCVQGPPSSDPAYSLACLVPARGL
jgi:hypothetical protein